MKALPSFRGSKFFETMPPYQTLPVTPFSTFPAHDRNHVLCIEVKPLLVRLGSLGTTSGTRPHCCTPISVPLVVVQTRPDIRIRVRRIVIRIRVRHTAIRIRVVVAAIDHTAYGSFHLKSAYCQLSDCKGTHFQRGYRKFHQLRRAYARFLDVFVPQTSRFALCRFAPAFRLRHLGQRLERCHAFRNHDFAAEGQTRPERRIRVRRIVTRMRARHTAIRKREVVAAKDHTAC